MSVNLSKHNNRLFKQLIYVLSRYFNLLWPTSHCFFNRESRCSKGVHNLGYFSLLFLPYFIILRCFRIVFALPEQTLGNSQALVVHPNLREHDFDTKSPTLSLVSAMYVLNYFFNVGQYML